jgi:hypothetical protein
MLQNNKFKNNIEDSALNCTKFFTRKTDNKPSNNNSY